MFRCFVDDSGRDGRSPKTIAAGWVARCDDWERFTDAWQISLEADNNPKALKSDEQGRLYFKYSEAVSKQKCFEGFTSEEAALKAVNLAHLFIGIPMVGYVVT